MMKITLTEGFGKDFAAKNVAVSLWLACFCVFQLWLPLYCIWQHDCVCVCFGKVRGQSGVKVLGQSPVRWGFMVMIHSFKNPCWWLGFITFMNDTRVSWCCAIEYADAVGGRGREVAVCSAGHSTLLRTVLNNLTCVHYTHWAGFIYSACFNAPANGWWRKH